jgi:hypothetical protein
MSRAMTNYRIGRVLLHAFCALHDRHWDSHWRGMVREFTKHFVQPDAGFPFVVSGGHWASPRKGAADGKQRR